MESPYWEAEDFRVVIGATKIDYDADKEDQNRAKHKYSLVSAVNLLEHLILPVNVRPFITRDASTCHERRHEHMTVDSDGKVVLFVTTMRENETIRVISLRRAHDEERKVFACFTGFYEKTDLGLDRISL